MHYNFTCFIKFNGFNNSDNINYMNNWKRLNSTTMIKKYNILTRLFYRLFSKKYIYWKYKKASDNYTGEWHPLA